MAAHASSALLVAALVWRSLSQSWVDSLIPDAIARTVVGWGFPLASVIGSASAIVAGSIAGRPKRVLVADAVSVGATLVVVFALTLGASERELVGLIVILVIGLRLAPAFALSPIRPSSFIFALVFATYALLAGWHQAASLPLGDQVHYLLASDRLAHGSLDATIDPGLFRKLTTLDPTDADVATHVVNAPLGARTVQGYAIPLLLIPGWVAAGRFGAELVVALAAAWAATMTALILRDTVADPRLRGWVWAMTAFFAPLVLLAMSIYPNAFGAAAIATAYRFGFTAPIRRPVLAGAIGGLTFFLNPRDGLVFFVLLVAVAWYGRSYLLRFALAGAAILALAAVADVLIYGIPLPYAGYVAGTAQAQALTNEPSLTFRFWVGLPAMLFDRTFGLAGSAPWLFIGVIGAVPALRAMPRKLAPAG